MKTIKIVASPGVNAVNCLSCKEGTIMIPVTMREMARLRCMENIVTSGVCDNGHRQQVTLTGWPLFWSRNKYIRT